MNYAFEPPKPPFDDEGQLFLDPINPQSELSDALHDFVENMLATEREYRERLHRHYDRWKAVVDDPEHPDHRKIRTALHDDPTFRPALSEAGHRSTRGAQARGERPLRVRKREEVQEVLSAMSEHQCYEFVALGRPLKPSQMTPCWPKRPCFS